MILSPIEILQFVWRHREHLADNLTQQKVRECLGPEISVPSWSRALSGRHKVPTVEKHLGQDDIQKKCENMLGVSGLFGATSEAELAKLLQIEMERSNSDLLFFDSVGLGPIPIETPIAKSEDIASANLAEAIQKYIDSSIITWSVPEFTGAEVVARLLCLKLKSEHYREVVHLMPGGEKRSFSSGLAALDRHLESHGHRIRDAQSRYDAIESCKILLVVHFARILESIGQANNSGLVKLIEYASHTKPKSKPRILFIGSLSRGLPFVEHLSNRLIRQIYVPDAERVNFFNEQFLYFNTQRSGEVNFDYMNPRLKRAKWMLTQGGREPGLTNGPVTPNEIRILALFASNWSNYAYFDPTIGFTALSGMPAEQLPAEMQHFLREAELFLHRLSGASRRSSLQLVRWLSVALYWMTPETLRALSVGPSKSEDGISTKRIAKEDLKRELDALKNSIYTDKASLHSGQRISKYVLPLGVRAVVQEAWRKSDPAGRALAHYRVAERLWAIQHDRDKLAREYPLPQHWGRSRHHFLSECLRHLVRACEGASGVPNTRPNPELPPIKSDNAFPNEPTASLKRCDVAEVMRFCFEELYHRELNGDNISRDNDRLISVGSRRLSKRHGAFHLSVELLQLMSGQSKFPEPHSSFSEKSKLRYVNDLGFALLDLGQLQEAEEAFEFALGLSKDQKLVGEEIRAELNLALVRSTRGSKEAMSDVSSVLKKVENILEGPQGYIISSSETQRLKRQLQSRKAELNFIQGDFKGALQLYENMPQQSLRRDAAYYRIIIDIENDQHESAMAQCLHHIFDCTSRGEQHEALIFRLSLSRILRKTGFVNAAETTLDKFQDDIIQYGCSARVYFEFLLEAGKNLIAQERFTRSYAAYLLPCIDRSKTLGFHRVKTLAVELAIQSLGKQLLRVNKNKNLCSLVEEVKEELSGKNYNLHIGPLELDMKVADHLDPQYSYDHISTSNWQDILTNANHIEAEIERISAMRH